MEVTAHERIAVTERSQVAALRVRVQAAADRAGLNEASRHRAVLAATEVGTNLVKHATGGEVLLRPDGALAAMELLSVDRGPGMDVAQCMVDGFSSAGSPGTGLGAVRRLSLEFDAHSNPSGTVVRSLIGNAISSRSPSDRHHVGGISVAQPGETACGDAWALYRDAGQLTLIVADGLGHGDRASEAARIAVAVDPTNGDNGAAVLERMHAAIRHTRGAAAAVVRVADRSDTLAFAGVGNVSGIVLAGDSRRQMVSANGTLGFQAQTFREFTYPWGPGAMLIVFTDGLTSHWTTDVALALRGHHPSVIAAALYRDYWRGRDDVTVVVVLEG
jgi:anti-sigma regulatory factor (Ser/Thr protein kinase)